MERIKVLCKMILIIACTVFACTFVSDLYPNSAVAATAYEDLLAQYQSIYDKLQITEEVGQLISKDEFQNGLSDEELQKRVVSKLQTSKNAILYSEETFNEVATQYVEIYKSQKEVAKDPILKDALNFIRLSCAGLVVLSAAIIFLIQYIGKRKKKAS